jgi:hypothetical protein
VRYLPLGIAGDMLVAVLLLLAMTCAVREAPIRLESPRTTLIPPVTTTPSAP